MTAVSPSLRWSIVPGHLCGCLVSFTLIRVQRALSVTDPWLNLLYFINTHTEEKLPRRRDGSPLMQHDRRRGKNIPKEEEEEKSAFARRRKPAYSLYAQFNPAYLCRLCISPTPPRPPYTHTRPHTATHTKHRVPIYMKHQNRFRLWLMLEPFLRLTALEREK